MSERKRYLYRVVVEGLGMRRHYQSRSAAQRRAVEWSRRVGYKDVTVRVDRSAPITFETANGEPLYRPADVIGYYRDGVAL